METRAESSSSVRSLLQGPAPASGLAGSPGREDKHSHWKAQLQLSGGGGLRLPPKQKHPKSATAKPGGAGSSSAGRAARLVSALPDDHLWNLELGLDLDKPGELCHLVEFKETICEFPRSLWLWRPAFPYELRRTGSPEEYLKPGLLRKI